MFQHTYVEEACKCDRRTIEQAVTYAISTRHSVCCDRHAFTYLCCSTTRWHVEVPPKWKPSTPHCILACQVVSWHASEFYILASYPQRRHAMQNLRNTSCTSPIPKKAIFQDCTSPTTLKQHTRCMPRKLYIYIRS